MDEYVEMLRRLADADSADIVSNSSADHAAAVIAELLRRAKKELVILTGRLNPVIYAREDLVSAMGDFLSKGGKVQIIAQNCRDEDDAKGIFRDEAGLVNKMYKRSSDFAKQIQLFLGTTRLQNDVAYHFLSADKKSFRFEPDNTKHVAFASFNRPELASKLVENFATFVNPNNGWTRAIEI